jgi:hypothetical protein
MAAKHSAVGVIGMVLSAVGVIVLILSVYSVATSDSGDDGSGGGAVTTVPAGTSPAAAATSDGMNQGDMIFIGGGAVLLVLGLILCAVGRPKPEKPAEAAG